MVIPSDDGLVMVVVVCSVCCGSIFLLNVVVVWDEGCGRVLRG